jgi:arsenate reductase
MAIRIYGYPGCTTVKRAREWADGKGLAAEYAHFSRTPDLEAEIAGWAGTAGIDAVFNDRAQTFKKLDPAEQAAITASDKAKIAAMAADPRLIKRPVGTDGGTVLTGFKQDEWERAFA